MFGLVGTSLKMRFIIDRGLNQKMPCQHQIFMFLKVISRSSKSQISLLWKKKNQYLQGSLLGPFARSRAAVKEKWVSKAATTISPVQLKNQKKFSPCTIRKTFSLYLPH